MFTHQILTEIISYDRNSQMYHPPPNKMPQSTWQFCTFLSNDPYHHSVAGIPPTDEKLMPADGINPNVFKTDGQNSSIQSIVT